MQLRCIYKINIFMYLKIVYLEIGRKYEEIFLILDIGCFFVRGVSEVEV